MSTYDCVATFHTNPYTCGVARFNGSLAEALKCNLSSLSAASSLAGGRVLLSIKLQEVDDSGRRDLETILKNQSLVFDVFLHAVEGSDLETRILGRAERVFSASAEIATEIKSLRPDVLSLFAPGAPVTARDPSAEIKLLTFGMAHKISAKRYQKLGKVLTATNRSFQLEVSSALHEGTSFDENFFLVGAEISEAVGGNVVFLGFLADQEVSRRLQETTALVAFFPKGVRENNTTVMSAMAHGCAVISNLDSASPSWMKHEETIFDINQLGQFPDLDSVKKVGKAAQNAVAEYSFVKLAELIQKI